MLNVWCVSRRAENFKKWYARLPALSSAARTKVLKGSKSSGTSLKEKKADVEDEVKQACIELNLLKALVAELEACAKELEKTATA